MWVKVGEAMIDKYMWVWQLIKNFERVVKKMWWGIENDSQ